MFRVCRARNEIGGHLNPAIFQNKMASSKHFCRLSCGKFGKANTEKLRDWICGAKGKSEAFEKEYFETSTKRRTRAVVVYVQYFFTQYERTSLNSLF